MNVFQGGFLGLDNIGVFDRSAPLPTGGHLEQSDGTSWMAMYTPEHAGDRHRAGARRSAPTRTWRASSGSTSSTSRDAMNNRGDDGIELWDEEDGFYYDVLHLPRRHPVPAESASMVGLIPLFAVETLEPEMLRRLHGFQRAARMVHRQSARPHVQRRVHADAAATASGGCCRSSTAISFVPRAEVDARRARIPVAVRRPRACRGFTRTIPTSSRWMARSTGSTMSRRNRRPASSAATRTGAGPIWFPVNFLLIESLQKFHHYFGDDFTVECPTGSGRMMTLWQVAAELSRRLSSIFLRGNDGRRPVFGNVERFQQDPHWRDLLLFHEYFHGDDGSAVGASHQTGWTGLVAKLLKQSGEPETTSVRRHQPIAAALR